MINKAIEEKEGDFKKAAEINSDFAFIKSLPVKEKEKLLKQNSVLKQNTEFDKVKCMLSEK